METSGNRTALGVSADIAQLVGNRLRRARESIGRSTSALSAKIKVREHYLVAIEDGQWNELPPGLNGRGLVRIYARELSVSVPELDQAANPSVMPAEQDAQAPYQVTPKRDHVAEREMPQVRTVSAMGSSPVRATEVPTRTNTLVSPQRPARASDLPATSETKRTSAGGLGYKNIESTPEEEPLDVITPDVASILGITLENFEEAPKPRRVVEPAVQRMEQPVQLAVPSVQHVEPLVPVVEPAVQRVDAQVPVAEPVVQRTESTHSTEHLNKKANKKHGKGKNDHKEAPRNAQSNAQNEEIPLVLPEVFTQAKSSVELAAPVAATVVVPVAETVANTVSAETFTAVEAKGEEPTHVVEQANESAVTVAESPAQTSSSVMPEIASVLETTVLEQSAVSAMDIPPSTPPGVSAAEEYLRSHAPQEPTATSTEVASSKGLGQTTRWAMGLVAASVVALLVGQVFMRPDTPATDSTNVDSRSSESVQATSPSDPQENSAASVVENNTVPEAQQPPMGQVAANTQAGDLTASAAGQAQPQVQPQVQPQPQPQAPAQVTGSDANKTAAPAAATEAEGEEAAVVAAQEQEASAETPSPSAVAMIGSTAAVLTLSEPLEIQITADGKKIYSGTHNAGKVEIKFNKRAEIFVQDGSKARLKYAGWDHGTLGLAGRKRRIVLNAEKFSGSSN